MKKIYLIMMLSLLFLSGCSTNEVTSDEREQFVVGTECAYAPFNWQTNAATPTSAPLEGAGHCDGYDIEIAHKIADVLDRELVVKKIAWEGLQPALESGEIDAIIAGMTKDAEREKSMDFTEPYFESDMVLIVRKGSEEENYTDINDFKGKKVVGQLSTNYDTVIDQIEGVDHVTPKKSYSEMVVALQKEEVDAITGEVPVAMTITKKNPDLTYITFEEGHGFVADSSVSVAMAKGSKGGELFEKVEEIVESLTPEEQNALMQQAVDQQVANENKTFFEMAYDIFIDNAPMLWYGVKITLLLSVAGTFFGLIIGLLFGGLRAIKVEENDNLASRTIKKLTHLMVNLYVWFFRGTPMMVQAMFMYYGLKPLLHWEPLTAGIVIISINTGAYMVEIIRSGIQSVDKGQSEAARSLGMSATQTMLNIVLPQAIRNTFPSIGNEFIVNIKDSSMLNVISVVELFFQSTSIAGATMRFTETFVSTSIIYLLLTSIATLILNYIERRLTADESNSSSRV